MPSADDKTRPLRNRRAALLLFIAAPIVAELGISTPIRNAWLILLRLPMYGGGTVHIRELVARTGRGWPSVIILGLAYELVEDGIGLQAVTSPRLYHAADWGGRLLGVNLPYWEINTIYHVIFTIAIPIAIVSLISPADRHRPYLGRPGLVVFALVFVIGVALVRISVPPLEDPGYRAPSGFLLGVVLLIMVLGFVALRWAPTRRPSGVAEVAVPAPMWLAPVAAVATGVTIGAMFPLRVLGARQPSFTQGWWVLVPMILVAALCLVAIWALSRWSGSALWSDLHMLALVVGALVGRMLIGIIVSSSLNVGGGPTPVDRVGQGVLLVLPVILGPMAARRLRRRGRDTPAADGPARPAVLRE